MRLGRLAERVRSAIDDVDKLLDAEVSDKDKTIVRYHLFIAEEILIELSEGAMNGGSRKDH